ncbi:MAG: hypothetical protein WDW36_000180 [Sanguina aurantia]
MDTMLESPLEPWDASHHGSSFGHDAMSMAPNQQAMPRPGSSQSAAGGVPGVPGGGISKQAAAGDSDLSLGRESGATLVGNQGTAGEFQGQRGRSSAQKETPVPSKMLVVQRLYHFSVEIWPGPTDSVYRHTKLLTVKNKYILLNNSGITMQYKQVDTPDERVFPDGLQYGVGQRFAGSLPNNARCALHWDNCHKKLELVIRPVGQEWLWSGSFPLPDKENYFGLRIRNRNGQFKIIPVNITVGAAGSVLVTLKSERSVPPYLIVNRCKDITIHIKQSGLPSRAPGTAAAAAAAASGRADWDCVPAEWAGSGPVPFAWDEPQLFHRLDVVATSHGSQDPRSQGEVSGADPRSQGEVSGADPLSQGESTCIELDEFFRDKVIPVRSTHRKQLLSQILGSEYRATANSQRWVYADGPTRILCFSEDKAAVATVDDVNSLLNLTYRLHQTTVRLREVSHRLGQQLGTFDRTSQPAVPANPAGGVTQQASRALSLLSSPRADDPSFATSFTPQPSMGPMQPDASQPGTGRKSRHHSTQEELALLHAARAESGPGLQAPAHASAGLLHVGSGCDLGRAPAPAATAELQLGRVAAAQRLTLGAAAEPGGSSTPLEAHGRDAAALALLVAGQGGGAPPAPHPSVSKALGAMGGDLKVRVIRAQRVMAGGMRSSAVYRAKVHIKGGSKELSQSSGSGDPEAIVTTDAADSSSSSSLRWDYEVTFHDVSAVGELVIEVWRETSAEAEREKEHTPATPDLQQQRQQRQQQQRQPPSAHPSTSRAPVVEKLQVGVFCGCVEIPLQATVHSAGLDSSGSRVLRGASSSGRGAHVAVAGHPDGDEVVRVYPLTRRNGAQAVTGELQPMVWMHSDAVAGTSARFGVCRGQISMEWVVTQEGLLAREVAALDRILTEKLEMAALLNTVSADASAAWVARPEAAAVGGPTAAEEDTPQEAQEGRPPRPPGLTPQPAVGDRARQGAAASSRGQLVFEDELVHAKALSESYFLNLDLSILEVRNLAPREGWRTEVATAIHGRGIASLSKGVLPQAEVAVTVGGETQVVRAKEHSVSPRLSKRSPMEFKNVAIGSHLLIQVLDHVGQASKLLGRIEIPLQNLPSMDPVYVWLQVPRLDKKHGNKSKVLSKLTGNASEPKSEMCIFVRFQVTKPQVTGTLAAVSLDLAGIGLCAKNSVDELFNFSVQRLRAHVRQTRTELQLAAAINALQLDNQMLDTLHPVVLSTADSTVNSYSISKLRQTTLERLKDSSKFEHSLLRTMAADNPLITFQHLSWPPPRSLPGMTPRNNNKTKLPAQITRSFAAESSAAPDPGARQRALSTLAAAAASASTSSKIISFKRCNIEIGTMDLISDQRFLEAVLQYCQVLPTANLWQDAAWQADMGLMQGLGDTSRAQHRAAGGRGDTLATLNSAAHADASPTIHSINARLGRGGSSRQLPAAAAAAAAEISSPAGVSGARGAALPGAGQVVDAECARDLSWLVQKEEAELAMMKGQSSTWFFLENFSIGPLAFNVTLALSSNFKADNAVRGSGGRAQEADQRRSVLGTVLTRLVGANGFQLINVTNAYISLQGMSIDNCLVNRVALHNQLWRHYSWTALAEARRMLGGAGPAIAAIPATVLWAGISLVDMAADVAAHRLSLGAVPPRIGYILTTSAGQMVSVFSQTLLALMSVLPTQREGKLSDSSTLARYAIKPQTVSDALYLAQKDILLGLMAGGAGLFMDPFAGLKWPGSLAAVGFGLGVSKALLGLVLRPAAGGIEGISKVLQGVGLLCLGTKGIQGKLMRRVRAPGSTIDDVLAAAAASKRQAAYQASLVSAWQRSLPHIAPPPGVRHGGGRARGPPLQGGAAHERARGLPAVTYKVKWLIPNEHIDNIRSVEKSFRISIEYRRPIQLGHFVLKVPLRQGMRTTSSESHRNLILRLNRHIGRGGYVAPVALAAEHMEGAGSDPGSLRIALRRASAL